MQGALRSIASFASSGRVPVEAFPWHELRYEHCQAIRAHLDAAHAPATANKMLAALRGTLREAWRLGLMTAEECERACDLAPVRGSTVPKGRALSHGELGRLLKACGSNSKNNNRGVRDAALVAVLYSGGLRRSEAVALDLGDYEPATEALTIRSGKGRKGRVVYVPAAADRLSSWLELRGPDPGPLFLPIDRVGRVRSRRLSGQAVLDILGRLGERAGVKRFSPHDLRRTFIGDLLDAGVDISTAQQLAGHSSVTTTQRYDRRGEDAKRRAAGMLRLP